MAERRRGRFGARLARWAGDRVERPWLAPVLAAIPAADFVLPVMPNQMLLLGLSALAPHRWPAFAVAFASGTALGGGLVAVLVQSAGAGAATFLGDAPGGALGAVAAHLAQFGLWYLAAVALLPATPRLAVLACAAAGFDPPAILATLFLARLVPCGALAAAGARGARWGADRHGSGSNSSAMRSALGACSSRLSR